MDGLALFFPDKFSRGIGFNFMDHNGWDYPRHFFIRPGKHIMEFLKKFLVWFRFIRRAVLPNVNMLDGTRLGWYVNRICLSNVAKVSFRTYVSCNNIGLWGALTISMENRDANSWSAKTGAEEERGSMMVILPNRLIRIHDLHDGIVGRKSLREIIENRKRWF